MSLWKKVSLIAIGVVVIINAIVGWKDAKDRGMKAAIGYVADESVLKSGARFGVVTQFQGTLTHLTLFENFAETDSAKRFRFVNVRQVLCPGSQYTFDGTNLVQVKVSTLAEAVSNITTKTN